MKSVVLRVSGLLTFIFPSLCLSLSLCPPSSLSAWFMPKLVSRPIFRINRAVLSRRNFQIIFSNHFRDELYINFHEMNYLEIARIWNKFRLLPFAAIIDKFVVKVEVKQVSFSYGEIFHWITNEASFFIQAFFNFLSYPFLYFYHLERWWNKIFFRIR